MTKNTVPMNMMSCATSTTIGIGLEPRRELVEQMDCLSLKFQKEFRSGAREAYLYFERDSSPCGKSL